MSSETSPAVWQPHGGDPLASVHPDAHDVSVDLKTDHRRTVSGSRRSGRRKDDDEMKNKDGLENGIKKEKESKSRNRRPREKSTATNPTSNSRKRPKLELPKTATETAPIIAPATGPDTPQNHQMTRPVSPDQQLQQQHPLPRPASASLHPPSSSQSTTFSFNSHIISPFSLTHSYAASQSPPPPSQLHPPQRTSGQNYDPIRSAFDTSSPALNHTHSTVTPPARDLSPGNHRASASPAISSIIDPPHQTSQTIYDPIPRPQIGQSFVVSVPTVPATPRPSKSCPSVSSPARTPPPYCSLSTTPSAQESMGQQSYSYHPQSDNQKLQPRLQFQQPQLQDQKPKNIPSAPFQPSDTQPQRLEQHAQSQPKFTSARQTLVDMDVNMGKMMQPGVASSPTTPGDEKVLTEAPPSKAPSPLPPRAKDAHMLPQGSGLISDALFGKGDSNRSPEASSMAPSIIIHVPLQGSGNMIINFARLAEEQYGFAALHPRLAKHREQLARIAAAGAALEKNGKGGKGAEAESADEDLSLDVERDSELDGDTAMGGMGPGTTTKLSDAGKTEASDDKKRRRRKKVEEYDRDDPFVDDSELVWQEQAAASKDGFFVYSGPLVPEGDKVQVERADGTIKRGRGRGRGGRGRGSATASQQPIAAAPASQGNSLSQRGAGPRGGTSRRPRASKKQETSERDRPATKAAPGRGSAGRGGGSTTRGGKTATSSAPAELAATPASKPNLTATAQVPGSLAPLELIMKQ